MKALSVRMPWAWLIVHGYKPEENRTWKTDHRGWVLIHAGKLMSRAEYDADCRWVHERFPEIRIPTFAELRALCGGIVGKARLTGCISTSASRWFNGPHAFTFADATPLPFAPCQGALGFFTATYTEPAGQPSLLL